MTAILYAVINAVIAAIAAAAGAALGILPDMPDFPEVPPLVTQVSGWINWFFPVGTLLDIFTFLIVAWVVWVGASAALRWGKVIE